MTELVRGRTAVILLAEDNDNDVELTKISFRRVKFAAELHHVPNGEECMAFLRKGGPVRRAPTPDIVLLDLNMPRMDGMEVMEEIGKDDRLKHLVIVVMTSSDADQDVLRSYQLRCNSTLGDYWFTLVTLPKD